MLPAISTTFMEEILDDSPAINVVALLLLCDKPAATHLSSLIITNPRCLEITKAIHAYNVKSGQIHANITTFDELLSEENHDENSPYASLFSLYETFFSIYDDFDELSLGPRILDFYLSALCIDKLTGIWRLYLDDLSAMKRYLEVFSRNISQPLDVDMVSTADASLLTLISDYRMDALLLDGDGTRMKLIADTITAALQRIGTYPAVLSRIDAMLALEIIEENSSYDYLDFYQNEDNVFCKYARKVLSYRHLDVTDGHKLIVDEDSGKIIFSKKKDPERHSKRFYAAPTTLDHE